MEQQKPVTLKTIADALGVKPTTVSKALRDESDVSLETKRRVKEKAAEMGYRPNIIARSLRQRRTFAIGAVVPEISTSFHSLVIRGFYQKARELGYEVLLMISNESSKNERRSVEYLASLGVDGIVISISQETTDLSYLKQLHDQGMPMVFYDRIMENMRCSTVSVDDESAAFEMVSYLIETGKKYITYLGPTEHPVIAKRRFQGYCNALKNAGRKIDPNYIVPCWIDDKDGFNATRQLFENGIKPDAIFCINDLVALGAGRAIHESGYKIPQDIALAGFGDNVETALLGGPITTVNQSPFAMGQRAMDLIIDEIETRKEGKSFQPKDIIIETNLIIRSST